MIRLDNISKQNGHQILFIEHGANMQTSCIWRAANVSSWRDPAGDTDLRMDEEG
jgi:hypothetical protein